MTTQELDTQIQSDPAMQDLAKNDPTEFTSQVEQLYHRFGYNKYGAPLSLAQKGFGKLSRSTGIPEEAIQGVAAMILPTAGTLTGAAIGSRTGQAGAVGGAMVGSLAGTELNSALGITEPTDNIDKSIALGSPLAGPVISRAAKDISKILPGAGYALHELATDTMEQSLKGVRVTKEHVDAARYTLGKVPEFYFIKPTKLVSLIDEEIASTSKQATLGVPHTDTALGQLETMKEAITKKPTLNFSDVMSLESAFNKLKVTNPSDTLWSRASKVIIDDLDTAATNDKLSANTRVKAAAGSEAFKRLVTVNKAYHATESLDALAKRSVSPSTGDPNLHRFDIKAFFKGLEQNEDIKSNFSPAEILSMKDSIKNLGYLAFTTASPSLGATQATAAGVTGGATYMAGSGYGSTVVAGLGAGAVYTGLVSAIKTEPGRKAIKYLATEGKGKINVRDLQSVIGQITAGAASGLTAGVKAPSEGAINAFPNQQ